MLIGTNFPLSTEYSSTLREQIDAGHDPREAFAAAELDYVELALHGQPLQRESLEKDVLYLRERGIRAHFHPYFNCAYFATRREPATLRASITTLLNFARHLAQEEGREVVLNFHAASAPIMERSELLEHSYQFYHWLVGLLDVLGEGLLVTTEHQLPPAPREDRIRIGDSYEELLLLAASSSHPRFGLCWDMGHSILHHLYHRSNPIPPPQFLPLVRHVHIHDVDYASQIDHRLIGLGASPLRKFVQLLHRAGYQGAFTMEYPVHEIFGADYALRLRQSRNALLDMVPRS